MHIGAGTGISFNEVVSSCGIYPSSLELRDTLVALGTPASSVAVDLTHQDAMNVILYNEYSIVNDIHHFLEIIRFWLRNTSCMADRDEKRLRKFVSTLCKKEACAIQYCLQGEEHRCM